MIVMYVHSPITFSMGRQLINDEKIRQPLVVCGRGMAWDGPHLSVVDDGIRKISLRKRKA